MGVKASVLQGGELGALRLGGADFQDAVHWPTEGAQGVLPGEGDRGCAGPLDSKVPCIRIGPAAWAGP